MEPITFTRSPASQPIDMSDPDLKGMIDRLQDNQQTLYAIKQDRDGMMLMMRILYKNCSSPEIAEFLKSADSFFGVGVKSLEECFPANSPVMNIIKQIAAAHLTSSSFDNTHYLAGECALALYKICNFGYTESENKTHKKVTCLMRSILGIEDTSRSAGTQLDLSNLNLSGINLKGMDLSNADLSNADLSDVKNWDFETFFNEKSLRGKFQGVTCTCPRLRQIIDFLNGGQTNSIKKNLLNLGLMDELGDAITNIVESYNTVLTSGLTKALCSVDISLSNLELIPDLVKALSEIKTWSNPTQFEAFYEKKTAANLKLIPNLVTVLNKIEASSDVWEMMNVVLLLNKMTDILKSD